MLYSSATSCLLVVWTCYKYSKFSPGAVKAALQRTLLSPTHRERLQALHETGRCGVPPPGISVRHPADQPFRWLVSREPTLGVRQPNNWPLRYHRDSFYGVQCQTFRLSPSWVQSGSFTAPPSVTLPAQSSTACLVASRLPEAGALLWPPGAAPPSMGAQQLAGPLLLVQQ
jgi:hypothetical protein